jgi:hypothetical protein
MLPQIETADRSIESSDSLEHLLRRLAPLLLRLEETHGSYAIALGQKQIHHRRRREACAVIFTPLLSLPSIGKRRELWPRGVPKVIVTEA